MKHLFLFPFAGGTSIIYSKWRIPEISIHPIDYRGHGFRNQERMDADEDEMVQDLTRQIQSAYTDEYFIFGHSMGGLFAWMVTYHLEKEKERLPNHIFISACEPPDCIENKRYATLLEDDALRAYLCRYNRIPEKRLDTKVFSEIICPVIKNDFRILSRHEKITDVKISVPMTILSSKDDEIMRYRNMRKWEQFGTDVSFINLQGGHFYIEGQETREKIIRIVENRING